MYRQGSCATATAIGITDRMLHDMGCNTLFLLILQNNDQSVMQEKVYSFVYCFDGMGSWSLFIFTVGIKRMVWELETFTFFPWAPGKGGSKFFLLAFWLFSLLGRVWSRRGFKQDCCWSLLCLVCLCHLCHAYAPFPRASTPCCLTRTFALPPPMAGEIPIHTADGQVSTLKAPWCLISFSLWVL